MVLVGPTTNSSLKDLLPLQTKQFMFLPDSVPVTPAELNHLYFFFFFFSAEGPYQGYLSGGVKCI